MRARVLVVVGAVAAGWAGGRAGAQGVGEPPSDWPAGQAPGSSAPGQALEQDAARAAQGLDRGAQRGEEVSSILGWLHESDATAIRGAKLAQQKGSSRSVKQLAARVVRDRTAIEQELSTVARASGVAVPSRPGARGGAATGLSVLRGLRGKALDQAFLSWLASREQKDAGQAETARADAQAAGNAGLAALLGKLAPQLQSHAESAQQLARASSGQGAASTSTGSRGGRE